MTRDMVDSTNLANVPNPETVTDVLVYTDGRYANTTQARQLFPAAALHTISAVGQVAGRWIDVEQGAVWPPATAVNLYLSWRVLGCKGFYCSQNTKPLLVAALAAQNIAADSVEWFEADPTGVRHVIAGNVATQWGWFGGYDESTLAEPTPNGGPPVPSKPLPVGVKVTAVACNWASPARLDVVMVGSDGNCYHKWWDGDAQEWNGPDVLNGPV